MFFIQMSLTSQQNDILNMDFLNRGAGRHSLNECEDSICGDAVLPHPKRKCKKNTQTYYILILSF